MMPSETVNIWRDLFTAWPASIPKRGILVSTLNETTPFKGFMIKGDMLLLERTNPDSLGARFVVMGFDAVYLLKLTDPLAESVFTSAGFVGQFAKL